MTQHPPSPLHRLWISIGLIHATVIIGAVGLMLTGDRGLFEAIYFTIVILTTVGMEGPKTDADRAWSIVIMIAGVGTVIYATGVVVAFFVEGEVRDLLGRHKVHKRINLMHDHYIVVGFGRMGQALCTALDSAGKSFVLIEEDEPRCVLAEVAGWAVIHGDGMHEQALIQAGIERAKGLASCLPRDENNVFVTLSASGLRPDLHIVARAEDTSAIRKLERAGASRVICPPQISALQVSDMLTHPGVDDVVELDGRWPNLELSQVRAEKFQGMVGSRIDALVQRLGGGVTVIAVTDGQGQRQLAPSPETLIRQADQLVIAGPRGWLAGLSEVRITPGDGD